MANSNKQRLPLKTSAYPFAERHGLAEEVSDIEKMQVDWKKGKPTYNSTVRRGRIIQLFKQHGILDDFLDNEWPYGRTEEGMKEIASCLRVLEMYDEQLGMPKRPNELHQSVLNELESISHELSEEEYFALEDQDSRNRCLREIVQRRGQAEFRTQLLEAYERRCAVTGCDAVQALEAAHISPYRGQQSQHVTNGLLLRADIHTLFDLDLIGVRPDNLTVAVADSLLETSYADLDGQKLNLPSVSGMRPSKDRLTERWLEFKRQK